MNAIRVALLASMLAAVPLAESQASTFQKAILLTCANTSCSAGFPKVAKNRKLVVRTASCVVYAQGTNDAPAVVGRLFIENLATNSTFKQFFRLEKISGNGYASNVFAVPTVYRSGDAALFQIILDGGGSLINGECSLTGELSKV